MYLKKSNLLYKIINYSFYELSYFFKIIFKQSFSQKNEDIIVDNLLKKKLRGYYVDIGCHNPIRFSNTFFFYLKRNWSGVCIDPQSEYKFAFNLIRPKDKYLNLGVGDKKQTITFYKFNPKTLSTFSKDSYENYLKMGYRLIKKEKIKILPLRNIIKKKIDLLSIDTEGFELSVLKSINWKKPPSVIIIETNSYLKKNNQNKINSFLNKKKMKLVNENIINSIYIKNKK